MKTIKIIGLLTGFMLAFGCSSNNNKCEDPGAWNFDSSSNCMYTKVIFYAPSNLIGGVGHKVVKIEVFRGSIDLGVLIGTITELPDSTPAPEGCNPSSNSIEYQFQGKTETELFRTRYYFENGVDDPGESYHFSTSNSSECITQKLTI